MITAVIVTFNNPAMLRDLLRDLQGQSLVPERIIVVDNSTRPWADHLAATLPGLGPLVGRHPHGLEHRKRRGKAIRPGPG